MSNLAFAETGAESAIGSLALRRLDDSGLLLPLDARKITIGGGCNCTLRLGDDGVRPLHCLVTCDPNGLTVRRWSDDTLLNGELFSEAALTIGDRLTVGPVDLELVDPSPYGQSVASFESSELGLENRSNMDDGHVESARSSAPARATHNRERAHRLAGEIRKLRDEYHGLQASVAEFELRATSVESDRVRLVEERDHLSQQLQERSNELNQARNETTEARQTHQGRERELTNQVAKLEQQIGERDAVIEELKHELLRQHEGDQTPTGYGGQSHGGANGEAASHEWNEPQEDTQSAETVEANETTEWVPTEAEPVDQTTEWQGNGATADPICDVSIAESSESTTPDGEDEVWGRLNSLRAEASSKLHSEVEHTEGAVAEHKTKESDEQGDIDDERDFTPGIVESVDDPGGQAADGEIWDQQDADSESRAVTPTTLFDPPTEDDEHSKNAEEPVSYVEKYKHLLPDDDSGDFAADAAVATAAPQPSQVFAEPVPAVDVEEDESIEDYMSKMMTRLCGESGQSASLGVAPSQPVQSWPKVESAASAAIASPEPPKPKEPPLASLDELKVAPKPEQSADMTALRDLANNSARQAIKIANSKRAREKALSTFILSFVTGGGGTYLLWLSKGELGIALFCGAAAVAAGGYWACWIVASLADPSLARKSTRPAKKALSHNDRSTAGEEPHRKDVDDTKSNDNDSNNTQKLEASRGNDIVPIADVVMDTDKVEDPA